MLSFFLLVSGSIIPRVEAREQKGVSPHVYLPFPMSRSKGKGNGKMIP